MFSIVVDTIADYASNMGRVGFIKIFSVSVIEFISIHKINDYVDIFFVLMKILCKVSV